MNVETGGAGRLYKRRIGMITALIIIIGCCCLFCFLCDEPTPEASTAGSAPETVSDAFGPCLYYANARYGQQDCSFEFYYMCVNGRWRAYIQRMPPLGSRSGDLHRTHRHKDGYGNHWVCFDPDPVTLKDMMTISRMWADRELEYIATGTSFENQRW